LIAISIAKKRSSLPHSTCRKPGRSSVALQRRDHTGSISRWGLNSKRSSIPSRRETLLELRADGRDGGAHITIVPPSVADGERREWCRDAIDPAAVDSLRLRQCMARLAVSRNALRLGNRRA
jgi:hypothetical protein